MRKVIEEAVELIKKFEGFRLEPYYCDGKVPTIGYGTTVYPDGKKVTINDKKITKSEAEAYLLHSINLVSEIIDKFLRKESVDLNDNQFGALVSFGYNLGTAPIVGKDRSMADAIRSKDYQRMADAFELYVFAGKIKLAGLVARRKAEKALFLKGA